MTMKRWQFEWFSSVVFVGAFGAVFGPLIAVLAAIVTDSQANYWRTILMVWVVVLVWLTYVTEREQHKDDPD